MSISINIYNITSRRMMPVMLAPSSEAAMTFAPLRSAPARSAPLSTARRRSACRSTEHQSNGGQMVVKWRSNSQMAVKWWSNKMWCHVNQMVAKWVRVPQHSAHEISLKMVKRWSKYGQNMPKSSLTDQTTVNSSQTAVKKRSNRSQSESNSI